MFGMTVGCSKPSATTASADPATPKSNDPDQSSPEAIARWFLTEHAKKEPDLKAIRKVLSKRLTEHFDELPAEKFERWVKEKAGKIEKLVDVGKGEKGSLERVMIVPIVIQAQGEERRFSVKVIKEGDLWYWEDL